MSDLPPSPTGAPRDPAPSGSPSASPSGRSRRSGSGSFRHAKPTSRSRKALKIGAVGIAAVLVAIVAFVGYGWYRYNQINREDLDLASSSGGVQNFLIVGSDSRSVVDKNDPIASAVLNAKGADQAGQRSDTIMVARVDSNAKTIDLISFPRDLWVPIQPSGENERINTAFAQGKDPRDGAQRLINTIKADFNIDINNHKF